MNSHHVYAVTKPKASNFWMLIGGVWIVFLLGRYVWGQEVKPLSVQTSAITGSTSSQSARNPAFILAKTTDGNSLSILWRIGVQDKLKANPGEMVMEPRRTHWAIIGVARQEKSGFEVSKAILEFNYGQADTPDDAADFFVVNGGNTTGKKTNPSLLLHPMLLGGGTSSNYRVRARVLDVTNKAPQLPKVPNDYKSEIPHDSTDPIYLAEISATLKRMQNEAEKGGGRVINSKDQQKLKVATPMDYIFIESEFNSKLDYYRFRGTQDVKGDIWLTGLDRGLANTDTPQAYLWVTNSKDGAKTWGARKLMGRGNYPTIAGAKNGDLLVFSTQTKQFGWQGEWPVTDPKTGETSRHWPGYGPLMMQRSRDSGQTWSKPRKVTEDDLVIQNRVYRAPDGRLWLVYVQSDAEGRQRTSLWLTSSTDDGQTWRKPRRLTDGKTLDREPDIIWHNGKLLIAFSRAGRDINTNIWMAEVDLKK